MSATAQQNAIGPKAPRPGPRVLRTTPKEILAGAFQTVTNAADSLEEFCGQLQNEVLRLRFASS